MKITWTSEPHDGYSIAERLLEDVMFIADITMDLERAKELKTFLDNSVYTVENVRPATEQDKNYLLHIGGEGAVALWCERMKDHMLHSQSELMTDEIFNRNDVQLVWNELHED